MSRRAAVLALLAALLAVPSPSAAADPYGAVRAAATDARRLAGEGRWADAHALVADALALCPPAGPGRPCRLLARFSLGYLAQREAAAAGTAAGPLLDRAAAEYERVLAEVPDHAATLDNLALVHLARGDRRAAADVLRRRLAAADEGGLEAALRLGDLLAAEGRWDDALAAYQEAVERDPGSEAPRQRIVDLYARLPAGRMGELYRPLAAWSDRFPAAAEAGYRLVLARAAAVAPRLVETVVLEWAVLLARQGRLTEEAARSLPAGVPRAAGGDLARYLRHPTTSPGRDAWWLESPPRRHGLAEVALALGRQRLVAGDPAGTAALWEAALAFAPEPEAYLGAGLRGARFARLDLHTALAALYGKHPALDPDGRKLARVIADLFRGKGSAYDADDLEAIQRHHTILGMIYVERDVWSSSHFAMNWVFQLQHALRAADAREQRTGYYQPLPDLKALVAQGYARAGRRREVPGMRLKAAEAYLDTDELDRVGDPLGRIDPADSSDDERRSRDALGRVLATRLAVARAGPDAVDPASPGFAFGRSDHGWLDGAPLAGLAPPFVARQRFKALADLAGRAQESGRAAAAAHLAGLAFEVAVGPLATLVGTADVIRLERVGRLLMADIAVERRRAVIEVLSEGGPARPPLGARTRPEKKRWLLFLPTETRPAVARMSADWLLAGRVARVLQADPALSPPGAPLAVSVSAGRVTVAPAGADGAVRAATEPLRRIDGLRELVLSEEGR